MSATHIGMREKPSLTSAPFKHIPTQSVSKDARERTIALYAPSKTFNLAGLVGSYHIIYNRMLRDRVEKASSLSHYNSPNVLSVHRRMDSPGDVKAAAAEATQPSTPFS